MIHLLKHYYTRDGKKFMVLYFSNGKYLCDFGDGKKLYLKENEIFETDLTKVGRKRIEPTYQDEDFNFTMNKEDEPILDGSQDSKMIFDGSQSDELYKDF